MTVKTTGLQYKAFIKSQDPAFWPEGAWMDDAEVVVDGRPWNGDVDEDQISDTAEVRVTGGVVFLSEDADDGPSVEAHLKRWLKAQTTMVVMVEIDKVHKQALCECLAKMPFKAKVLT